MATFAGGIAARKGMKELWLFTTRFPYGTWENSLEHELPVLCRHFDKVLLFPLFTDDVLRPVPANAEVRNVLGDPFRTASIVTLLGHVRSLRPMWREVFASAPDRQARRRQRNTVISQMRQALERVLHFRDAMAGSYDPGRVVLYSSWALDWATILCLWKEMDPRIHFVMRMRGFDLYHHRAPDGWQVFQSYQVRRTEHVYTTSVASSAYLISRYPELQGRISVFPTATDDHGAAPWSPSSTLRIVSCSNLIPIKRVHLIAEAIAGMDRPVHWTHFGEGPERERIEALTRDFPAHITAELNGRVPNAAIIAWYRNNPVDLFVHVSSTEGGVSVAVQEAVSFGIPVLGADAGGVGEIVNDATGELLPHDVTAVHLRARIEAFAGRNDIEEARARARAFWNDHFNAAHVHERFARDLISR